VIYLSINSKQFISLLIQYFCTDDQKSDLHPGSLSYHVKKYDAEDILMNDYSMHCKDKIVDDLKNIGIENGDGLFVHASLGSIGTVVGGARAVVEALIEAIGSQGVIAMPAFSSDAYEQILPGDREISSVERERLSNGVLGFDIKTSPVAGMGSIAETFRTWPGTSRSTHPCVSICARGKDSDIYLQKHSLAWACGPDTPLGALLERPNMKILLIGVGWNRCSALHTAETLCNNRRTKVRRFKHQDSGLLQWIETPDVADDGDRLFPLVGADFEQTDQVRAGLIGAANTKICSFPKLVSFATSWLEKAINSEKSQNLSD
jgi:aminoglycoside 3-N-acetyltransferase